MLKFLRRTLFALCSFSALAAAGSAHAAGTYDGIWSLTQGGAQVGYVSIHETGGVFVMIELQANESFWGAYSGARNGSSATLTTLVHNANTSQFDLTFSSATAGVATETVCTPKAGGKCAFPAGTVFQLTKVL